MARGGAAGHELGGAIEGGVLCVGHVVGVRGGAVPGPVEALGRGRVRVRHVVRCGVSGGAVVASMVVGGGGGEGPVDATMGVTGRCVGGARIGHGCLVA